jgi:hypothetical protein
MYVPRSIPPYICESHLWTSSDVFVVDVDFSERQTYTYSGLAGAVASTFVCNAGANPNKIVRFSACVRARAHKMELQSFPNLGGLTTAFYG